MAPVALVCVPSESLNHAEASSINPGTLGRHEDGAPDDDNASETELVSRVAWTVRGLFTAQLSPLQQWGKGHGHP
jgi:hypothetical protein